MYEILCFGLFLFAFYKKEGPPWLACVKINPCRPRRYYFMRMKFVYAAFLLVLLAQLVACDEDSGDGQTSRSPSFFESLDSKSHPAKDSGFPDFKLDSWMDMPILIMQPQGDATAAARRTVIAESKHHGKIAYVFGAGADCLGSFVTDEAGRLLHFEQSLFCSDSVALRPKRIRVLWKNPGIPVALVSELSGSRGSALRIHRLDGGHGELFIDERVNNDEDCGPEEDEGVLPCFSRVTKIALPDSGAPLPDTLFMRTTGTVLDGQRLMDIDERDTVVIPWNDVHL